LLARLKAISGIREPINSPPVPVQDLPELHSSRLVLRALTVADAADVYSAIDNSRAEFNRWFTWAHDTTPESVRQSLDEAQIAVVVGSEWHYGIFERVDTPDGVRSGKFLGRIGLSEIDHRVRSAELGYWLDKDCHGQGIMTETVQMILTLALYERRRSRIDAYTDVENFASQRVLLKCGFRKVGSVLNAVNHPLRGWRDQYHFMLVSDGR
jgi:RimJ/RimL family protein N-acetyltransferase